MQAEAVRKPPSIETIRATTLPDSTRRLINEYSNRIGIRDEFIWKWVYHVFPPIRLSTVDTEHEARVRELKVELTIFITLLDDLADNLQDNTSFQAARMIPFTSTSTSKDIDSADDAYLDVVSEVWTSVERKLQQAPRFDDFEEVFYFDLRQTVNAIDYGRLMNERPALVNVRESDAYCPHNMAMFTYANIDLMHSSSFADSDLSILRDVLWDLQRLARIGNWVSTWERELFEQDLTSGVVVRAISEGEVQPSQFKSDTKDATKLIDQINATGIEDQLLEEWDELFMQLRAREYETESLDVQALIEGLQTVRALHLCSKGLK